jgi:two-component system response regulator
MLTSHRRTILLVEDSPDDERLTLRALNRLGLDMTIDVARDGMEAIKYLETCEPLPVMVLLDLKLPLLNGLQVLDRIRANPRTKALPVIVLTSSDEPSDINTAYKLHANSFVQKPVDFSEFSQVIGELGKYWFVTNVNPPTG